MSITCTFAGGPDLVLEEDCSELGGWLGDGVIQPVFDFRRTHTADSAYVGGKQLLAVVLEQSELNFPVIIRGSSAADLDGRKTVLEEVFSQFAYLLTLTVDGVPHSYIAEPALPTWGKITIPQRRLHVRVGAMSVPINPEVHL